MHFNSRLLGRTLLGLALVVLTACGGGGGGSGIASSNGLAANAMRVTVDAGPAGTGYNVNRLYADVTICQAGNSRLCQTIDHVLVDTGSTGLRLLSTVLNPALNLGRITGLTGFPVLNCAQFVDGSFAWGPTVRADIQLGGKLASNVPMQIIGDPGFNGTSSRCSFGTAVNSAAVLGANGILGVGQFKEDCGTACNANAANGFYFTCNNALCTAVTGTTAATSNQVKNPVPFFAGDNNGIVVDLPNVSAAGAASLVGSVLFGIGTQANNQFATGSVLTTSPQGYFTTLFAGRALTKSFLDTGSNGLYFDSTFLPLCPGGGSGFYCPNFTTGFSASLVGTNGQSAQVGFAVDNALGLFTNAPNAVLPTLAGNIGDARIFDWGLAFFYGRRVFIGIEGMASNLGTGPLYAF